MEKSLVETKLKEVTDKIVKEFKPEKIILFGSYAWGKPNEDSDVDLFIVKETKNTRELARKIDGSFWGRSFAMDIIVSTPSGVENRLRRGDFFFRDIFDKGTVLYERK